MFLYSVCLTRAQSNSTQASSIMSYTSQALEDLYLPECFGSVSPSAYDLFPFSYGIKIPSPSKSTASRVFYTRCMRCIGSLTVPLFDRFLFPEGLYLKMHFDLPRQVLPTVYLYMHQCENGRLIPFAVLMNQLMEVHLLDAFRVVESRSTYLAAFSQIAAKVIATSAASKKCLSFAAQRKMKSR